MNLLSVKQSPGIGGLSGLPAEAGIVGVRPEDLALISSASNRNDLWKGKVEQMMDLGHYRKALVNFETVQHVGTRTVGSAVGGGATAAGGGGQ